MSHTYMRAIRYFVYGLVLNLLLSWLGVGYFGAPVALAFGLIWGPISGLSFGLSYMIVSPLFVLYYIPTLHYLLYYLPEFGWPPEWYPSHSASTVAYFIFLALNGVLYGYIPSKLYHSGRATFKRLFTGFIVAFISDAFVTTVVTLAYAHSDAEFYHREYMMYSSIANSLIPHLILGGLSAWLCVTYLKQVSQAPRPATYLPSRQPFPSSLRCPSCGYDNPTTSVYCGKCGTLLTREGTKIY